MYIEHVEGLDIFDIKMQWLLLDLNNLAYKVLLESDLLFKLPMAQPARLQSVHINIDTVTGWQNDDLQRLKNLKRLGQKSQLFRDHFREQQDNADNAGPDLQQVWLKKMKKITISPGPG
ncbi:hypothetical protein C8R42DRAFT_637349 [Lentinula raphanica]|nr:hypothetical protein C8R42DRAFT_637349 [Lentinula raphanica]